MNDHKPNNKVKALALTIAAIGVVYGDIGTSPLYAINQIFFGHQLFSHLTPETVLGCISLVIWSLTVVISVKYLSLVLKANNDGEGGVFSLYAWLHPYKKGMASWLKIVLMLAAGLLFGEGVITPAISVLSAVEGLEMATSQFQNWVVPITVIILAALFFMQRFGTTKMGKLFGPIAILWFLAIGALGVRGILLAPQIIQAFNPLLGIQFLQSQELHTIFIILGGVMLVITGGEAVFADMGHFGATPIQRGWFLLVYPSLILNYLGQGAFLLSGQAVQNQNIFYSLVPQSILLPMIVLATLATIVASQALISGAFSLASQAIALGLFPRLKVVYTHEEHAGQIYVPFINLLLFIGSVSLVLHFKSSNALASAYGLSVTGVMFSTSLAMMAISILYWKWKPIYCILLFGFFALIDGSFLIANSLKFFEGGFIPLILGFVIFSIMRIWRWGRKATFQAYSAQHTITMKELIQLKENSEHNLDRNVVFMVPKPIKNEEDNTPALVQFFLNRYQLLPKHILLVEVIHRKIPFVHGLRHKSITFYKTPEKGSIISVTLQFGFMEDPNVEKILEHLAIDHQIDLPDNPHTWLVHVSQEYLIAPKKWSPFKRLRFRSFLFLRQITQPSYYYYGLGRDVNLSADIMPVKLS